MIGLKSLVLVMAATTVVAVDTQQADNTDMVISSKQAFKDDYTATSDFLNQDAPWSWWKSSSAPFALFFACMFASALLVDAAGGRGPKQNGYIAITTVVMLALGALAFTYMTIFPNILEFCALLIMSWSAFGLLVEALGWEDTSAGIVPVEWAHSTHGDADSALGAGGREGSQANTDVVPVQQAYSAHGDVDSALHTGRSGGSKANVGNVAVQPAQRRSVTVINSTLLRFEKQLSQLGMQIADRKRSLPMRGALLGLAIYTGGLSKLFQIPYDLVIRSERRNMQLEFERIRFRMADACYCEGWERVPGVHRPSGDRLMPKAEWKTAKTSILLKLKKVGKPINHEVGTFKKKQKFEDMVTDPELATSIEDFAFKLGGDFDIIGEWAEMAVESLVDLIF